MKNIQRVFVAALVATVASVAQAQTYTTSQNFNVASGTTAQSLFDAGSLTVAFAGLSGVTNQWEPDTGGNPLTVQGNALGFGDGGFEDAAVIFETTIRQEGNASVFQSFTIDVVPGTSPSASATAVGYFQTLTGEFDDFEFNVNQITGGTLNLTTLLPSNTVAIVLPGNARYDNVSLVATVVPEAGALPLAMGGLLTLAGAVVVRRKK